MRSQHIAIYWNTIRDRYPLCEQQPPISQAVEGAPEQIDQFGPLHQMGGEVYRLPRFWFSSEAHSTLIQVQRNAFWLNWRRSESVYHHYESVEKDFWSAFEGYKRFVEGALEGKLDVVKRCELTYVNLIGTSNFFACPAEIKHILPPIAGLCEVQNEARRLVGLNVSATYQLTDHLRIESSVKLGRRKDTNEEVALFELKALGTPKDLSLDGARLVQSGP